MSTEDAQLLALPELDAPAVSVLIVRAPYYRAVVDGMTVAADAQIRAAGARCEQLDVAGAFELPQAIRLAMRGTRHYDAFVALGCVVRGETDHYDHICRETMAGLMAVSLQFGLCLGTGLLTVDTLAQAEARSGASGPNKGAEAAVAALWQIAAARRLARA